MAGRQDETKTEQWRARLDRFHQSGLTVARFCASVRVSVNAFYYWAKRHRTHGKIRSAMPSSFMNRSRASEPHARGAVHDPTRTKPSLPPHSCGSPSARTLRSRFPRIAWRRSVAWPSVCTTHVRKRPAHSKKSSWARVEEGAMVFSVAIPSSPGPGRIYLDCKDVDMRLSFDGLHALVKPEFRRAIRLGDWFLFLNRRLDRIKLLHWDRDGMAIWRNDVCSIW